MPGSRRVVTLFALAVAAPIAAASPGGETTLIASVATGGDDAALDCNAPSISADGRWVAFESAATNLVSGDTNNRKDVFLHDLQTGTTTLVSRSSGGTLGNNRSERPRLSADGAFVVFQSVATNLVSGDTNGEQDVFVHEVATGITTRVSLSTGGAEANKPCEDADCSADGVVIVFSSTATNLVAGDTNGKGDVFVHDRATGVTTRASLTSSGGQSTGVSSLPRVSADGNLVVFTSPSSNLVSSDFNGRPDVFVRDRAAATTTRVSVAADGSEGDSDSEEPAISADGRFVAFMSLADDLVPFDTNNARDVFVVELATGAIEIASVDAAGVQGAGDSREPALSDDGRYVAFTSVAGNLVAGDYNVDWDVFVRDRALAVTGWMSLGDEDQTGYDRSDELAISGDGAHVAFASRLPDLVDVDTDKNYDVFVRERDLSTASAASYGSGTGGTLGIPALGVSAPPVLHTTFSLLLDNSSGWYTVGVIVVGTATTSVPVFGGELLVDPLLLLAVALPPGTLAIPESVPPDEALGGEVVHLQALELDPGAIRGTSFTPGLTLTLGR